MVEIKVLNNFAEVSYKQNQKVIKKLVGISEIPALFDVKTVFDSGIMPVFGTQNAFGVQRIIQNDTGLIILVQAMNPFANVKHTEYRTLSEGQKEKLGISHISLDPDSYVKDEDDYAVYKNVYFPNLLMSLHLKQGTNGYTLGSSGILGFKEAFITDQTQLYDLPYSNLYRNGTHGGICWGSTELKIQSIAQSVSAIHSFLGSTMNTDLFDSFDINDMEIECSSQLLAYLAMRGTAGELMSFPYDEIHLEPLIKYNGLISYLKGQWK